MNKNISLLSMIAACSTACSSTLASTSFCPDADIKYIAQQNGDRNKANGTFSMTNRGEREIRIAVEAVEPYVVHGQVARTDEKQADGAWRPYNTILEEQARPNRYLTVRSGEFSNFTYDANGLFLNEQKDPKMIYSIVVRSETGCIYRSEEFHFLSK